MKRIRSACMECDRDDFDGITPSQLKAAIKNGWKEVERGPERQDSLRARLDRFEWSRISRNRCSVVPRVAPFGN
jgi:hypothetical protein